MIFVSDFSITKILFTKIKTKTQLPCNNLAHERKFKFLPAS